MSKGMKVLLVTLSVAGIVALSAGSIALAAGNDGGDQIRDRDGDCDEICQQQLREQNENCIQIAEQNRTRVSWQDGTCLGNALWQQDESQTKGNRCGLD